MTDDETPEGFYTIIRDDEDYDRYVKPGDTFNEGVFY